MTTSTPVASAAQGAPVEVPTGPRGHWLLGTTELFADQLGCMVRWPRQYGDVFQFRVGFYRIILVSDPALVEEVFLGKARSFRKGPFERGTAVAASNGLFISEGDFWKRQRRMMSPPFHNKAIAGYAQAMVDIADRVCARWRPGEARDLYRDSARLALAVAGKTLFDADIDADASGGAEQLARVVTAFMTGVSERFEKVLPAPLWLPTRANRALRAAAAELDRAVYGFIAERRAHPERSAGRTDLLSLLLAAQDEDGGRMTDQQLRDEAVTLFVAGHETSAVTLAAALHFIAHDPQVQRRLQDEVTAVLGDRAPTAADLPALGYVERVVKEALRLFPPPYGIDREVAEDVTIGGYRFPRGHVVVAAPYALHRDPRHWPDPERFDPDRWATPAVKALPRAVYMPFGLGPRVCIGGAFAMLELVLVLARFCQRFQFAPVPGQDMVPIPGFALRPSQVVLTVQRRQAPPRAATAGAR
jgi:cytochrome P450